MKTIKGTLMLRSGFILMSTFVLSYALLGQKVHAENFLSYPRTQMAIDALVEQHGIDEKRVKKWMSEGQLHSVSVRKNKAPAEKTKTYAEYRPMFLSWSIILQGRLFMKRHQRWLMQAEQDYGVPAEIITAIIGIESRYGLFQGKHKTFNALGSLAVSEHRRADYFLREWITYIAFSEREGLDPLDRKGSYAGATGYGQFMPSSYEAYAVDFDQDGDIDIWNDPIDSIGSIANYLVEHRWKRGGPLVSQAVVTDLDNTLEINTFKQNRYLEQVVSSGWEVKNPVATSDYVFPIRLEGENGPEYWLGYRNFWSISRYNRSVSYAMAVVQLSAEINNKKEEKKR